jgi:hypothetical protein
MENYNVVAKYYEGNEEEIIAENLTKKNAEAVVRMAIMRRGVDDCYYDVVKVA